jgi:hypothetical protein
VSYIALLLEVPDRGSGNPTPLGGWDRGASGVDWLDGSVISRVSFFFFPIMRPPSREIVFARDSAAALQREAGVRYLEILAARAGIAVRGPT